ncbi:AAA family ATPase [Marinitoga sp. 1135]|uniref:AAA family ATPase n=1 Tax=Marinitoga sp. 1135 TaxID=1643333 RepID=UPI001585E409|nr:AAA family ATPase [Marinitoga sp. 1135]
MKKKIPYGEQNFERLRKDNYYYIDRTQYIEKLENLDEKYIVFLRPRKFGKTLFLDTLGKYYDINYKNKFEELFGDLYIGKNPTPLKNEYYILKMNFSGVQTENKDILVESFKNKVIRALKNFKNDYNLKIKIEKELTEPADIIGSFLDDVKEEINKPIYLLIDEYDHFANELLSFNLDLFRDSVTKHGFVRKFYEEIKKGTQTIIERIFMTGVSPIMLDSLTSGFNITMNITIEKDFNRMLGFTKEEVIQLLEYYEIYSEKLFKIIKEYYGGYKFSWDATETVYHPNMIFYSIKEYLSKGKIPEKIIDDDTEKYYERIKNLFEFAIYSDDEEEKSNIPLKEYGLRRIIGDKLKEICEKEEIFINELATKIYSDYMPNAKEIKSLLFYEGFLTLEKEGIKTYLKIPNHSMKNVFLKFSEKYY